MIIFNNHAFLLIQRNVLLQENRHKMHRKWKGKEPPSSRVKADVTSFWNIITNRVTFLTTSPCLQMLVTRLRIRWNKSCQGWYLCQLTSSFLACLRHGWWWWLVMDKPIPWHCHLFCLLTKPGQAAGMVLLRRKRKNRISAGRPILSSLSPAPWFFAPGCHNPDLKCCLPKAILKNEVETRTWKSLMANIWGLIYYIWDISHHYLPRPETQHWGKQCLDLWDLDLGAKCLCLVELGKKPQHKRHFCRTLPRSRHHCS